MVARTLGLTVAVALGCASLAGAETKVINRTLPLSPTGTVAIQAHNGSIQVKTWDRPEVAVHAQINWYGGGSSYWFQNTTVDVNGSSDLVTIKYVTPDRSWTLWSLLFDRPWLGPEVRYEVTAPRNARFEIREHNASVDIRDAAGPVRIGTHNGVVRGESLSGPVDVRMHNGWARLDFASFTQDARIETHNGAVELRLPSSSKFDFSALGHHPSVRSDFQLTTQASYSGRHRGGVSAAVNGGGPDLRVAMHNGGVWLRSK